MTAAAHSAVSRARGARALARRDARPPHGVASHRHAGPGWHPSYQACRGCGTRVIPHHAEGRCRDCYRAAHGLAGAVELWGEADEHPAWETTTERE